jgi:hypothetical protein
MVRFPTAHFVGATTAKCKKEHQQRLEFTHAWAGQELAILYIFNLFSY